VIEKGKFAVIIDRHGEIDVVGSPSAGGTFGELALMYGTKRAASVQVCSRFQTYME
jgi:CRP-like cAMP-binding protein